MLQVLGDVMPSGVIKLKDVNIKFREDMAESSKQRYRQTAEQDVWLAKQGFTTVVSSNVSALGIFGKDLYIRFLNGAVYRYMNNAELFDKIMRSLSKGRAVWKYIRRAGVPYERVGDMPIPENIGVEDLFNVVQEPTITAYEEIVKFRELDADVFDIRELALAISPFKTLN